MKFLRHFSLELNRLNVNSIDLYKDLWFELNKVFPRKLWTLTANAINHNFDESAHARSAKKVTQSDLIVDPLQVLRCDQRIFRWVNSLKKKNQLRPLK